MATIVNNLTILAVLDVEVSRAFYIEKLGFEEYLRTGGWSFLRRGSLHLRVGHCPGIRPISQCEEHSLIVQAVVDDANSLHREFASNGAEVSEPVIAGPSPWRRRRAQNSSPSDTSACRND